jgi:hypothetical protein
MLFGPIRLSAGDLPLRNASVIRPLLAAMVAGALAGHPRRAGRTAFIALIVAWLPWSSFRASLARLPDEHHPLRTAQQCLAHVRAARGEAASASPAVYLDAGDVTLPHPVYYYFRRLRPWVRADRPSDAALFGYLFDVRTPAPVLLPDWRQREFMSRLREGDPDFVDEVTRSGRATAAEIGSHAGAPAPAQIDLEEAVLLLPGPDAACAADVRRGRARP